MARIILDIPLDDRHKVRAAFEALDDSLDIRDADIGTPPGWADCLLTWNPAALQFAQLAPNGFIQAYGAGVDRILAHPALRAHTPIARLVDNRMSFGMTQHVALSILRWVRSEPVYREQQARQIWNRLPHPDLADWRIGILGLGALGTNLARALEALGFPVQGWRRRDQANASLSAFLRSSRVLVCLLPLTPDTRGLIDGDALRLMPAGSYLVNCGRGPVVVEEDLMQAIGSGHIAGAALDVFETEPLAPGHPFWTMPGVSVTPHIATFPVAEAVAKQTVANIRRLERGDALANLVDPHAGY